MNTGYWHCDEKTADTGMALVLSLKAREALKEFNLISQCMLNTTFRIKSDPFTEVQVSALTLLAPKVKKKLMNFIIYRSNTRNFKTNLVAPTILINVKGALNWLE